MTQKESSSLYLETEVARTAGERTNYGSLSKLTNALLIGYLEGMYDPWEDFDVNWGLPKHTWEDVEQHVLDDKNDIEVEPDDQLPKRTSDLEKRISRIEHAFEQETGIKPSEY